MRTLIATWNLEERSEAELNGTKYIVIPSRRDPDIEIMWIFPSTYGSQSHEQMAVAKGCSKERVLAAGSIKRYKGTGLVCEGHSMTCDKGTREGDSGLLLDWVRRGMPQGG